MIAVAGTRPPGRPRSDAARAAALQAVMAMLEEVGYAKTSMEGVAARAGIGKQTLYRWWPSLGALAVEAFLAKVSPAIAFRNTGSPLADLRSQLRAVAAAYAGVDGRVVRDLVAIGQADGVTLEAFVDGYIEPRRKLVKQVLERAVDRRLLRPGLDLDQVIDSLYGAIFFRLLVRHRPLDKAFVDRHLDAILAGIGA